MPAPVRPRMNLLRWLLLTLVLLVVVAASVVLVLHYRSRDPHTAARPPFSRDTRQVKPAIERRAQQFLAALRTGDEARLRAMAFASDDRANVDAFIAAFGRRNDQRAGLQTSDLGEKYGELDIAVPCKDGATQHAIVLFGWKRTSFVSSGWYAIINKPGTADVLPNGCIAP
jgi:hypothetical protein